jgi:hypothetical protein
VERNLEERVSDPSPAIRPRAGVRETVRVKRHLLNPLAVLLGAIAGVVTSVSVPDDMHVGAGIGVAGVVYLLTAALAGARPDRAAAPPRLTGQAGRWLQRAEQACRSLGDLARQPSATAQLSQVAGEAGTVLSPMRRLAEQIAAVDAALARVPVTRLQLEHDRLVDALATTTLDSLRAERQRALDSLAGQLAVGTRLTGARDTLVARLQATALGLEGLVARAAEVQVLAAAPGVDTSADQILELSADLDGLRAGLAEAEEVSRRVLDPGP